MFCTTNPKGVGTFVGDEGAPVVKDNVLIGIHCNHYFPRVGAPQIHMNVYAHMDWIQQELNNDNKKIQSILFRPWAWWWNEK